MFLAHMAYHVTYCDYNSSEGELVSSTSTSYDAVTAEDSAVYFWKPLIENTNYIPGDVVIINPMISRHKEFILFVGLVEPSVLNESKVLGYCDKSKFPADFGGSLVGVG